MSRGINIAFGRFACIGRLATSAASSPTTLYSRNSDPPGLMDPRGSLYNITMPYSDYLGPQVVTITRVKAYCFQRHVFCVPSEARGRKT